MRTYSRDDVSTHYGSDRPAADIKVRTSLEEAWSAFERDERPDEGFTLEWIRDNYSDQYLDEVFWMTCEWELEYLTSWADGSDKAGDPLFPDHSVTLEQDGRSGGWLVVLGLPDLEDWDAVLLGRWRRFERIAEEAAAGIPYQMLWRLYMNEWEASQAERIEAARAANSDIATIERTS